MSPRFLIGLALAAPALGTGFVAGQYLHAHRLAVPSPPRIVVSPAVRPGTIETILAFDAYLKKRNIDLILLAFPYRNELSHRSGEDWGDAASFVLKQARETGIECVDATAWMTASADRGQAVYAPPPEDFHPLADGYRAMFEAVGSRAWRSRGEHIGIIGDSFADGFHRWVRQNRLPEVDVLHVSAGSDMVPSRLAWKSGNEFLEGKDTIVWVLGHRYFSLSFRELPFPEFVETPPDEKSGTVSEEFVIQEVSRLPEKSELNYDFCHVAVLASAKSDPSRKCYLYFPVWAFRQLDGPLYRRLLPGTRVAIEGEKLGLGGKLDRKRRSHMVANDFPDLTLDSYWVGEYAWTSNNLDEAIEAIAQIGR